MQSFHSTAMYLSRWSKTFVKTCVCSFSVKKAMSEGPGLGIFTKHLSTDAAKATTGAAAAASASSSAAASAPSAAADGAHRQRERLDGGIFNEMERRELILATRLPPVNAFHRQLQWTRAQRLWRYPINNEAGEQ